MSTMSTMSTTSPLDLSTSEQEAVIYLGNTITWTIPGGDSEEFRNDPVRMLDVAERLTLAARVTIAARDGRLPERLHAIVREQARRYRDDAREVVEDAEMYGEEQRNQDALVLDGLVSLEQRLGAVTA